MNRNAIDCKGRMFVWMRPSEGVRLGVWMSGLVAQIDTLREGRFRLTRFYVGEGGKTVTKVCFVRGLRAMHQFKQEVEREFVVDTGED